MKSQAQDGLKSVLQKWIRKTQKDISLTNEWQQSFDQKYAIFSINPDIVQNDASGYHRCWDNFRSYCGETSAYVKYIFLSTITIITSIAKE